MVSAAVLVKLKPEFAQNQDLISFVDTLIRDTANPSVQKRGGGQTEVLSGDFWEHLAFAR